MAERTSPIDVAAHMGIVHRVARQMRRHPAVVAARLSFEELLSAGSVGLISAAESFDPARGLCFSTIAFPRVRGAMLDDADHVLGRRRTRRRAREVAQVTARLEREHGRPAMPSEVARALDISERDYEEIRADVASLTTSSIDEAAADEAGVSLSDRLAAVGDDPLVRVALEDMLRRLPARERLVIERIYLRREKAREVASSLRVSESRVSQLRRKGIAKLRSWWIGDAPPPAPLAPFRSVSPATAFVSSRSHNACPRCGSPMVKYNGRGRRPRSCDGCRTPSEMRHVLYMRAFNERRRSERLLERATDIQTISSARSA